MDAKDFDAWTRRRFGLAASSALTALFAFHNRAWGEPSRAEATHQECPADALDCVAGTRLTPDMLPSHPTPGKEPLMSHRFLRAPALALLAVLLVAGPAFSAVRMGTEDSETLIGTKRNDQITGLGGLDRLIGRAGNDTYFFDDGWGQDVLIEKRRQGKDTLDFSAVNGFVGVTIVREFDQFDITSESNDRILLDPEAGIPYIEIVIGGTGEGDGITTGGGPNTLNPGGGGTDILMDVGGFDDGPGNAASIEASNDTYVGFNFNTGTDTIRDWGGTDVVDMRPSSSTDVVITAFNDDGDVDGTNESLRIAMKSNPTIKVEIIGHFGPHDTYSSPQGLHGRIEKLIFADKTFTNKNLSNLP